MEVEVKIRLPNEEAFQKVIQSLPSDPYAVDLQENFFIDGVNDECQKKKVVFRLRRARDPTSNEIKKCCVTLKGNAILKDGISTVSELEETIPSDLLAKLIETPNAVTEPSTAASQPVITQFLTSNPCPDGYKLVGFFKTLRRKYHWEDCVLELDQTEFPFGKAYEIEVESVTPEVIKEKLESFLKSHNIEYSYSKRNKFVNMIRGSIE